jgi:hypothetical protein
MAEIVSIDVLLWKVQEYDKRVADDNIPGAYNFACTELAWKKDEATKLLFDYCMRSRQGEESTPWIALEIAKGLKSDKLRLNAAEYLFNHFYNMHKDGNPADVEVAISIALEELDETHVRKAVDKCWEMCLENEDYGYLCKIARNYIPSKFKEAKNLFLGQLEEKYKPRLEKFGIMSEEYRRNLIRWNFMQETYLPEVPLIRRIK